MWLAKACPPPKGFLPHHIIQLYMCGCLQVHVPEGLTGLDLDVIKLTAQFVARNGASFLTGLTAREANNPQVCVKRVPGQSGVLGVRGCWASRCSWHRSMHVAHTASPVLTGLTAREARKPRARDELCVLVA
jgi:hypothetical protein